MATNARYYVSIGGAVGDVGEIKYGFSAPTEAYAGIADELGVKTISGSDNAKGVAFGINRPKPPRIRVNYGTKTGTEERPVGSVARFCNPDKLGQVLNGAINDKKIKVRGTEYSVLGVSMPGI
jgi:hypothetical protein